MPNKLFQAIIIISIVLLAALSIKNYYSIPKIAYVKTGVILEHYQGMKEMKASYKQKLEGWQNNIDTLQYQVEQFQQQSNNKEAILEKQQMLSNFKNALEQKATEEEEKMLTGVVNQVNEKIEQYAKAHDYDVILGTTSSGNILYGSEMVDITELVLKDINESYKK